MAHHGEVTGSTETTAPAPAPAPAARSRTRQALGDMSRSLGLMALVIAGLLLLGPARTLVFPDDAEWQPVDTGPALRGFEDVTGTAALAPARVPDGWRANAARVEVIEADAGTAQLHIGWAVPGEHYAGLDETSGDGTALLRRIAGAGHARPTGDTTIGGVPWRVGTSARGEPVLSRQVDGLTVVVTGDAGTSALRLLAGSLR
jgi:hypothetical protein